MKLIVFDFFAGLLFLAVALDVLIVTGELILMLIFGAFGVFMTFSALSKEIKRRKKVFERIVRLKAGSVKTVGRLISCEGGVRKQSFSEYPDGDSLISRLYFPSYVWYARVEYECEDGSVKRTCVSELNKNPKKYMLKDVTVYYNGNLTYVEF